MRPKIQKCESLQYIGMALKLENALI
ncbi:hypothetical protein OIU79_001288 [Salix purpurea]|uniref:Uncharacterized protein n=1 Tax=Salix purpurea TaxID=77065 RepID=A0A9Q0V532_SALPP|nr:hypothetical protein OIU79_001288 [Salix purpurea]